MNGVATKSENYYYCWHDDICECVLKEKLGKKVFKLEKSPFFPARMLYEIGQKNRQNCQILTDIHKKMYRKMRMKSQ